MLVKKSHTTIVSLPIAKFFERQQVFLTAISERRANVLISEPTTFLASYTIKDVQYTLWRWYTI